jgi:hypothetical protein
MGILATGLPLALQDFGPWLGMNIAFLLGLFVLPRPLSVRRERLVKLLAIVLGVALFLYAKYGRAVTVLPPHGWSSGRSQRSRSETEPRSGSFGWSTASSSVP